MSAPKLGFIGFGEAGANIAAGLLEAGLSDITAYALECRKVDGVVEYADAASAIAGRDIVFSAVTASVAFDVAQMCAPLLEAGQIYIDINSVSPGTKKRNADVINGAGARFVECSVMGSVPGPRHTVPILLCGEAAPDVIDALSPYGMNMSDLGPAYGRAAATKMFRSVMIKGLEALLQECVLGADKYGAAEQVLESVGEGYPGVDWVELAHHMLGRTALHGKRRADEMDEVAATLRELGIEPMMAASAAKRIRWAADHGLKEKFGTTPPASFHDVLAIIGKN
jgi:3-hydroxyisobutyrate dehydrogenase-like beta-hydroxyacid dehydrogenase